MKMPRRLEVLSFLFRKIPDRIRGRWQLARLLMGRALDQTDCMLKTSDGQLVQVPCLREPIAFSILVDGTYEPETWNVIKARLPVGGAFVDIGANVGLFSLQAAKHVGPSGRVVAVEASEKIFAFLERNVRLSGYSNVQCLAIAATNNNDAEISFYDAPSEKFGMGSMAPQFNMSPRLVAGRTLDTILSDLGITHVDVLKVDVEGFEAAVFRGAAQTCTSAWKPTIVFEFLDWAEERAHEETGAAQEVLLGYGYALKKIGKRGDLVDLPSTPLKEGGAMLVAIPIDNFGKRMD